KSALWRCLSLRRRLRHRDVDIDLSLPSAKQSCSISEKRKHHNDHENHEHGNHAGIAPAFAVISHFGSPLQGSTIQFRSVRGGTKKGKVIALRFLTHHRRDVKHKVNEKQVTTKGALSPAVESPRSRAECWRHYSPARRRGRRGRVRSRAGCTSPGCTVGVGCGGFAPGGQIQISKKSVSR